MTDELVTLPGAATLYLDQVDLGEGDGGVAYGKIIDGAEGGTNRWGIDSNGAGRVVPHGTFAEFTTGSVAGGTVYAAGDAIAAGGFTLLVPNGVWTIRELVAIINGADVAVPGLTVALVPSAAGESYTPAADGDPWAPPLDARAGHMVLASIPTTDQLVHAAGAVFAVCPDRERRIAVAPRMADDSLAGDATTTLYAQLLTADGVTFVGGAIGGASIRVILEYQGPLPIHL